MKILRKKMLILDNDIKHNPQVLEQIFGARCEMPARPCNLDTVYQMLTLIRDRYWNSRDGRLTHVTFDRYGCVTSAADLSKSFGCLAASKMHERILFLEACGLI